MTIEIRVKFDILAPVTVISFRIACESSCLQ